MRIEEEAEVYSFYNWYIEHMAKDKVAMNSDKFMTIAPGLYDVFECQYKDYCEENNYISETID